jgi:hypothetical protein
MAKKGSKGAERRKRENWRKNVERQEAADNAKLLNAKVLAFQTEGLTASQINERYRKAGIGITTAKLRKLTGNKTIVSHSDVGVSSSPPESSIIVGDDGFRYLKDPRALSLVSSDAENPYGSVQGPRAPFKIPNRGVRAPKQPTSGNFWEGKDFKGLFNLPESATESAIRSRRTRVDMNDLLQSKRIQPSVSNLPATESSSFVGYGPVPDSSAFANVSTANAQDGDSMYYNPRTGTMSVEYTNFPVYLTEDGNPTIINTGIQLTHFPELSLQGRVNIIGISELGNIYGTPTDFSALGSLAGPDAWQDTLSLSSDDLLEAAKTVTRDSLTKKETSLAVQAPLYSMIKNKDGDIVPVYFDDERSSTNFGMKILEGLGEASLWLKETVLSPDTPIGSMAHVLFNAGIYGYRSVEHVVLSKTRDEEKMRNLFDRWTKRAEDAESRGEDGTQFRRYADDALVEAEELKVLNARNNFNLSKSQDAFMNAWDTLLSQDPDEAKKNPIAFIPPDERMSRVKELWQHDAELDLDAEIYRKEAKELWEGGGDDALHGESAQFPIGTDSKEKLQSAIDSIMKAQAADKARTLVPSAQEAYTWLREPENEKKFLVELAKLELQKGSPLSQDEIRRTRDLFVNPWTEAGGEMTFDFLNLIPAALMEKVFVPFKLLGKGVPISDDVALTISKVLKRAGNSPAAAAILDSNKIPGLANLVSALVKDIPILNRVVAWSARETSRTVAGKLYNVIGDGLNQFVKAYGSVDEFTKGIDDIVPFIKRALTEPTNIDEIYESAKLAVGGATELSLPEFKRFVSTGKVVDPDVWGAAFRASRADVASKVTKRVTKQTITELAGRGLTEAQVNVEVSRRITDALSNNKKLGAAAIDHFSRNFSEAYLDTMRVGNTRLLSDSVSGKVYDLLKNKWGAAGAKSVAEVYRHAIDVGQWVRGIWTSFVLPGSPRWTVVNLVDSTGRSLIKGTGALGDIVSLFRGLGKEFADEFGRIPLELIQSFSRSGVGLDESIIQQLIDGDIGGGPLSYIFRSVKSKLVSEDAARALSEMNPSGIKGALLQLWDGIKIAPGAVAEGASDFNAAMEFVLRARLFQREFYTVVRELEPQYLTKALDGLSPEMRIIAEEMWMAAGSSPAKLQSLVDSIKTGVGTGQKAWSLITPPDIYKTVIGDTPSSQTLFIQDVQTQIQRMISKKLKSGVEPIADDFTKLFTEYKDDLAIRIQEHLEESRQWMLSSEGVNPASAAAETALGLDDAASASSKGLKEAVEQLSAVDQIKIKKPILSKDVPLERLFDAATGEATTLRRVDEMTDAISIVKDGDNIFINVGQEFDNLKRAEQVDVLKDATIDVIREVDSATISQSDLFVDGKIGYDKAVRDFIDNPTFYATNNKKEFVFLADQMERNPALRYMYEKLAGKPMDFEDTANLFSSFSPVDAYADPLGYLNRLRGAADDVHKPPPRVTFAGNKLRESSGKYWGVIREGSAPEVLKDSMRALSDDWDLLRFQARELGQLHVPGPRSKIPGAGGRKRAWDAYHSFSKRLYDMEAALKDDIFKLVDAGDFDGAAAKIADVHTSQFADNFLKDAGFDIKWNSTRTRIVEVKSNVWGSNMTMDRSVADTIYALFFAPQNQMRMNRGSLIDITRDGARAQIATAIRDTFKLNISQSKTISATITAHANRWASITKRPIGEYLERLGFRTVEGAMELVDEGASFFRKAGISVGEDGRTILFGLDETANVSDVMSATGKMFADDLRDMAHYSPNTAKDLDVVESFLEEMTGDKINFSGIGWGESHEKAFVDTFNKYLADGHLGDLGLNKAFYKYKTWLGDVAESLEGSSLADELSLEVKEAFHRMFIETTLMPTDTTSSAVKVVASEYGIVGPDDSILDILNEYFRQSTKSDRGFDSGIDMWNIWDSPGNQDEFMEGLTHILENKTDVPDRFNLEWLDDLVSKQSKVPEKELPQFRRIIKNHLPVDKSSKEWEAFFEILTDEQTSTVGALIGRQLELNKKGSFGWFESVLGRRAEKVVSSNPFPPHLRPLTWDDLNLTSVSELLSETAGKGEIAQVLTDGRQEMTKELSEAWDAFKGVRDWSVWPEDALKSPDNFRQYLRGRIEESPRDLADSYRMTLGQVESFQNDILNFHAGADYTKMFSPHVPEAFVGDGVKTWIKHNEHQLNYYESATKALNDWEKYLVGMADDGHPVLRGVTIDQMDELDSFSKVAGGLKTELSDIALNGGSTAGRTFEGALPSTNKLMLDYGTRNNMDQLISSFIPFWMFPSRSLPMWAETLATHPTIVAMYYKNKRLSRSHAVQAGAVNSRGEQLRSLKGYVPISVGGEDFWFNPLAPLSFRYVLAAVDAFADDDYVVGRDDQEVSPLAHMAAETIKTGAHFGFSVAPWISWIANPHLPKDAQNNWPIVPQLPLLLSRWAVSDIIRQNAIYNGLIPEVHWHNQLVEMEVLESALSKLESGDLSAGDRIRMMQDVEAAIKNKDNDLWNDTLDDVYKSEHAKNAFAFFTGMYPKEFSDAKADTFALRNQLHLLRSSLNNEMQTEIFELNPNDEDAYRNYINFLGTDEGQLYRWRTDAGWIRSPDTGALVTDPQERNKLLTIAMETEKRQQLGFASRQQAMDIYNEMTNGIPFGSSSKYYTEAYEIYGTALTNIDSLTEYGDYYGTYKPSGMIQADIQEKWYRLINGTKPEWTGAENYLEYQAKIDDWNERLPDIGEVLLPIFLDSKNILQIQEKLHEDQSIENVFETLLDIATQDGMGNWKLAEDDIYDAMNSAHKELYWDEYWSQLEDVRGLARDFVVENFQDPPTAEEYHRYITEKYGYEKFTLEEVREKLEDTGQTTIQDRLNESFKDSEEEDKLRNSIWDLRAMAGPGSELLNEVEQEYIRLGGEQDDFSAWYLMNTPYSGEVEKLKVIEGYLKLALINVGVPEPTRETKIEWIEAQDAHDHFKSIVESEMGDMSALHSYYYGALSYQGRKEFKRAFRDEYDRLGEYQDIKDSFAIDNQTWAKYYNLDEFTEGERILPTAPLLPPVSGVNVPYPEGLRELAKGTLDNDISALYAGGNLSNASHNYLDSLTERYSNNDEWVTFIELTIAIDDLNSMP